MLQMSKSIDHRNFLKNMRIVVKKVFRVLRHKQGYKAIEAIKTKLKLSRVMRKPTFYICENKEADQRLCFR